MLAWRSLPFKVYRGYGCWGVYCSSSLCKASEGIYIYIRCFLIDLLYHFQTNSHAVLHNSCLYIKLSNLGGRLIIASDGIWDALSSEVAAKTCRGLPAELAARQVVKVIEYSFNPIFKLCNFVCKQVIKES